jgi:NADPH-dependent 2,4-dienoyl-CoA reductase/sulfur reductase-like enzyme
LGTATAKLYLYAVLSSVTMPSKANKTSGSRETARGSRDLSPSRSLPSSALPSASLNESKAHQPAESPIYDVAVVGAGLSGLQCAAALVGKHGLDRSSVIVLEASEKIGGRVEQVCGI